MRIGISLALSALVCGIVYAEEICTTTLNGSEDLSIGKDQTCTVSSSSSKVQKKIINDGTLIFNTSGAKITFTQSDSEFQITSNDRGIISVLKNATFDALTNNSQNKPFLIEGQDIKITSSYSLTLKTNSLLLGSVNKSTSIIGSSSSVSSSSNWGVTLDSVSQLQLQNAELKNIRLNGSSLTKLIGVNAVLENAHIVSTNTSGLTLQNENNPLSSFDIRGSSNTVSATSNSLIIEGEYQFFGGGVLDFVGSTITLGGNGAGKEATTLTKLTLSTDSNSTDKTNPKLGFLGDSKVLFSNVESSGLTLQIVKSGSSGATLHNINTTFTGGTLQALDRSDKDQILVIENGNQALQKMAGITINLSDSQDTTTTFLGSGIKVYGQDIVINGNKAKNTNTTNILKLQTIDDSGEITLGRENNKDYQDGYVNITGSGEGEKVLQLRSQTTTFGGNLTLQNLNIQTQSSDEGMVFVGGEGGVLTLSNVTITSGIDDEDNKNYQSLSFTSDSRSTIFLGQPQSSTPTITSVATSNVNTTIKASSLAFTNQDISLANAGSGGTLNLYSYGASALNSSGSGVGNFAFTDTSITNGSTSALNLYSSENAKVLAKGLTLSGVTLTTYKIDNTKTDGSGNKNAIDLSTAGNDFTTQGSVKIDTAKFLYGDTQGIGMDITIDGGSDGNGKLTLTSDTSGENFTFGGTLTIDNSSATNNKPDANTSQIGVELNGKKNDDSSQDVALIINGGLTAMGNATGGTTTTLKAKSFTFGEDSVVSSINGTLSLNATENGNIDLTKALTMLQGVSSAEATISKGSGTLSLGNVEATGKTKIENATFSDSSITIRSIDSGANTLTISSTSAVSGVKSIDIKDAMLDVKNGVSQELQLNINGSITSNGNSTITASSIKGNNDSGTYSINIESGTLTLAETSSAGDKIGSVTLGLEGKQGGNLTLTNNTSSTYHDFKAPNITSYNDSTIIANTFDFNTNEVKLSATDGELKLIAMASSNTETLTIQKGSLALNNASLGYYKGNGTQALGKMTLHNTTTSVAITSTGDSSIQAQELDLKGNTITSSEGVLTLQGVKTGSTLGAVTIGNFGGLTITSAPQSNSSEISLTDIKLGSTLTLTANAPYTSSASPLGGGKFGVLQAQSVNFTSTNSESPLIQIKVLDKPLVGEELFTLQEGGQVVVWTTDGITKGNTTAKQGTAITLDDISLDSGGYKSLSLSAELIPDSKTTTQVNAIKVLLSVAQSNASELTESISDDIAKSQMQTILTQGDNQTIINSILSSPTNPLKVGFAENIAQGNVVVVGNALNYIDDTFTSLSQTLHLNDRIQTQITLSQASLIEGRFARHNNPHQTSSELARFIRSYHNTHYASSDDELPSEEDKTPSGSGSLWVSYNGGLATGNSSNSTINGASAGYDHSIGSQALLGGFVGYAYGIFDGTFLHNTSHNVSVGLYSRAYFGSNEIDLTLSQNVALITSEIDVGNTTMPSLLNGAMQYNLYRTSLNARYGYTFKVGDEESPYYLKPLVGLNLSYTYQEGAETDAVASVGMNALSLFKMDLSVGMEMRKYINEGTYFFLMPLVERDLYGNSCEVDVGFIDSPNLRYTLDYQSQTSIAIYGGGEGNLTENLALNGSLGLKVGIEKSEVLTSWSVGLKYKF